MAEEIEISEEPIPPIISDDYLKDVLHKTEEYIRELRSQENYQLANYIIRFVTICENLHFQLKDEENKIKELQEKHVDAAGRIEEAVKISQRDHDVIKKLKNETKNAWTKADAAQLREQHTHESLNVTRERYLKILQELKKHTSEIEDTDELGIHKPTVIEECERLLIQNDELNKRVFVQRAYSDELQKKLEESLEKNRELFRDWDSATNESLSNRKKIDELTKKMSDIEGDCENVTSNMHHFKEIAEERHRKLLQRESQIKNQVEAIEKLNNDISNANLTRLKLEASIVGFKSDIANLKGDVQRAEKFANLKEDETKKLLRLQETELKKIQNLTKKIESNEKIISRQDQELANKKSEIITAEKERDLVIKSNKNFKMENEKLEKKIDHKIRETEKLSSLISTLKQEKEKIESENLKISDDLKISIDRENKLSSNVKKLQANLEFVESEKLFLNESIKQLNEDLDARKKQYDKIKIELDEANELVAHHKHEYSLAQKSLKEARSEYQRCHEKESDIIDRLFKYKHQIDDTNEKLSEKLVEITILLKKIKKMEKLYREVKRELERNQDELKICRAQLKNVVRENDLFKSEIRNKETTIKKMKIENAKILKDRDLISNQMYRRTDENSLLENQISILKVAVERGDTMYNERLEDIRMMKNEIRSWTSKCSILRRGLENTVDMRHEVLQLHRVLNQERVKAKVLEQEMTTPMNVHRWRKLSCRDPGKMELMIKYQRLQKNNLIRTAKLVKLDEIIKLQQGKIIKLENSLKKHSSLDLQEKLLFTRSQLSAKTKRMKAAIALSRASECDVVSKDFFINQLQKDLNELKSQLFKEKREKRRLNEKCMRMKKNPEDNCEEEMIELKNLGNALIIGIKN